jgi:hypothetical protein
LLTSAWLPACAIYMACQFGLPPLVADLTTTHFASDGHARMWIAVQRGSGFELLGVGMPQTPDKGLLEGKVLYLRSADGPVRDPTSHEEQRVRLIRRDAAGVLMETVRIEGSADLTCTYLVTDSAVLPVSQKSYGILDWIYSFLIGVALAAAYWRLTLRLRRAQAARAA